MALPGKEENKRFYGWVGVGEDENGTPDCVNKGVSD